MCGGGGGVQHIEQEYLSLDYENYLYLYKNVSYQNLTNKRSVPLMANGVVNTCDTTSALPGSDVTVILMLL